MSLLSNRPTNQGVVDVSDRVARALGIVGGTVAVSNFPAQDVIDRVGRLLGHVTVDAPLPPLVAGAAHVGSVNVDNFPSSTAVSGTVDVTDRAARLVGHVSVDSLPAGGIDVTDRSGRLVGHVTVDNFPGSTPTDVTDRAARLLGHVALDSQTAGLALDATLPKLVGTWKYYAGASGTVTVGASERVVGIAAHATTAGSFTINGGASVPVPANASIEIIPNAQLVAPTIVLTGCDSYFVETVL